MSERKEEQDRQERRESEAASPWLRALAEDARRPLDDGEAFAGQVLARWEKEPAGERPADPATGPAAGPAAGPAGGERVSAWKIGRWGAMAAAVVVAASLGWLATERGADEEPTSSGVADAGDRGEVADAEAEAAASSDPLGVLLQDVSRQIEQRPEQVRRAIEGATTFLDNTDWLLPPPGEGDGAGQPEDRRS